jgi:hypothetical protein
VIDSAAWKLADLFAQKELFLGRTDIQSCNEEANRARLDSGLHSRGF